MTQGFSLHQHILVTPAKAGVHHLSLRLTQRGSWKPDGQVMDSRVDLWSPPARGNDEVLVGDDVFALECAT
jgi:hypothetical protein